MDCTERSDLIRKIDDLSRTDLEIHIYNCPVCSESLSYFYDLYKKGKKDPVLDSFPPHNPEMTENEFLIVWAISLASQKERARYYACGLKNKLSRDEVKILIISLIQELTALMKVKSCSKGEVSYNNLAEIIEILDGEFLNEEFEMLFGCTKKRLLKIIEKELPKRKEGKLPRK